MWGCGPGGLCSGLCRVPARGLHGLEDVPKLLVVAAPDVLLAQVCVPGPWISSWAGWWVQEGWFMVLSWGAQFLERVRGAPLEMSCVGSAAAARSSSCCSVPSAGTARLKGKGPEEGGSCRCSWTLAVPGRSQTQAPHCSCGCKPSSVTADAVHSV